jgi:preprotein translocase subunit SecD
VSLRTKWVLLGLLTLFCSWISAANFIPEEQRKATPLWVDDVMRLGLDLRGGVHIVLGPDLDAAVRQELSVIKNGVDQQLADDNVTGVTSSVDQDAQRLLVKPATTSDRTAVEKILGEYDTVEVAGEGDYDLSVTLTSAWLAEVHKRAIDQSIEVIRRRIDDPLTGIPESVVTRQGTDRILVQIPGVSRVPDIFRQTGHLEFKIVEDYAQTEELLRAKHAGGLPSGTVVAPELEKKTNAVLGAYLLPEAASMRGDQLEDARVTFDQTRAERQVSFTWSADAGREFGDLTEKNRGRQLAILLDGSVVSAPVIQSRITQQGVITGNFSAEEANDLAVILRSGALPIPVRIEEERTIGPALGADSIRAGSIASIVALAVVVVFMAVYYRKSGLYASIALAVNVVLLLALLSLGRATLTMPGIAGLILTMGMAVDANVLIFERIREELRSGRTPRAAIAAGFERAFWTILDSNITTLIATIVLFQYGTGPIKGFAVTLAVGILTSVFTALVVTRALYQWKPGDAPVTELSV